MRARAGGLLAVCSAALTLLTSCAPDPLAANVASDRLTDSATRASLSRWVAQVDGTVDDAFRPFDLRTYVVARRADGRLEALMAEILALGPAPTGRDLTEYNIFILPLVGALAADFEAMAADARDELAAATAAWYDFAFADELTQSICARPSATLPAQLAGPCATGFREGPYLLTFDHSPAPGRALPAQFLMEDLSAYKARSFSAVVDAYLVAVARNDGTSPNAITTDLRLAMIDLTGRASDAFPELLAQAARIWSAAFRTGSTS